MKNYEKYAEKIREFRGLSFCEDFIEPRILKSNKCLGDRKLCNMLQMIWLLEDYEEPETDWSKVEVDTPILVRDAGSHEWIRRYFAKFEDGLIYAWVNGNTSWTAEGLVNSWKYTKLAESEEGGAK